MNKKAFLEALEKALIHNRCADIESVLEYYEELIEDKKESGKKEKDIISALDIDEIVKNVKVEQSLDEAVKKPTVSNGVKALIASLSILSIPMLIPAVAIVFAIIVTVVALIFSLIVTVGAIIFGGGVGIVTFIAAIVLGKLPVATSLFCIGVSLVCIGLFSILIKWVIHISKELILWGAEFLKERFNRKNGGDHHE